MSEILNLEKKIYDLNKLSNKNERFENRKRPIFSKMLKERDKMNSISEYLTWGWVLLPVILFLFPESSYFVLFLFVAMTIAKKSIINHKNKQFKEFSTRLMNRSMDLFDIEEEKENEIKLFIQKNINNLFEELEEYRNNNKVAELNEYIVDMIIEAKKEQLKNEKDYNNEINELSKESNFLKLRKEELEYKLETS